MIAKIEVVLPDYIKDVDEAHDYIATNIALDGDFSVEIEEDEENRIDNILECIQQELPQCLTNYIGSITTPLTLSNMDNEARVYYVRYPHTVPPGYTKYKDLTFNKETGVITLNFE